MNKIMIYVGSLSKEPDRDHGWIKSFEDLGWHVIPFSSHIQLSGGYLSKFQRRFSIGPVYSELQRKLLILVNDQNPVWVHFRLPIEFHKKTIKKIASLGIIVTEYFNDDPFSNKAPFGLNWLFLRALPFYNAHFVYREKNIKEFTSRGCVHVEHCPPTFDPARHINKIRLNEKALSYDAVFIGHYEDDWRFDCLVELKKAGFNVLIRGGGELWDNKLKGSPLNFLAPVKPAYGDDYNKLYSEAIAGLCFFSKINNDKWTERALEIVAVGGLLVCERTNEAETYFIDKQEAFFFSTIPELLSIIELLKNSPILRLKVQQRGYFRLMSGNNTIYDRAKQVHKFVIKNSKV